MCYQSLDSCCLPDVHIVVGLVVMTELPIRIVPF